MVCNCFLTVANRNNLHVLYSSVLVIWTVPNQSFSESALKLNFVNVGYLCSFSVFDETVKIGTVLFFTNLWKISST